MTVDSFETIYKRMADNMQANCDQVTDFNKGSIIRSLLEAVATISHKYYLDTKIGYDMNLKAIPYSIFGFEKKKGTKASGRVVFISATPVTTDTVIPLGTVVASGLLNFITTEIGIIRAGDVKSSPVSCQAENIGVKYNVGSGSITQIKTIVPDKVIEVSNPEKFVQGTDEESDSSLISRFKLYLNGLQGGNKYGIQSTVLGLDGVRSCSIEEHFGLKDDIYSFTVWVDDGTGGMTPALEKQIKEVIDGNNTAENPGKRVAGEMFDVLPALIVPININVKVSLERVDVQQAMSEITDTLNEYINSLNIGDDVLISNLIVVLKKHSYIKSLSVTTNAQEGGDYILNINQIARAGEITIEQINN